MKEHIILENARRYEIPNHNETPSYCTYNSREGYWVENISNMVMMKSNNPQKPISKKCDIETGEDQKGE